MPGSWNKLEQKKLEIGERIKMSNTNGKHGGARDNAGRKPKALKYAVEVAAAEAKIVAALPDVIDGLISAAKAGDAAAARYLMDRVLGRVKEQAAPPAEDFSIPETEEETDERAKAEASARAFDRLAML
jgi:hypothetical protein